MRGSRQFTKRVEIWQSCTVEDGFGGNTIEDVLIASSWAKVETMGATGRFSNRTTDLGVTETNQGVLFKLRKRNDLNYNSINQFIKYRGVKYIINSFPDNIDFNDAYIEIVATRETLKVVNEAGPIGGVAFPYTFNFILTSKAETVTEINNDYIARVAADGGGNVDEVCTYDYIYSIVN